MKMLDRYGVVIQEKVQTPVMRSECTYNRYKNAASTDLNFMPGLFGPRSAIGTFHLDIVQLTNW